MKEYAKFRKNEAQNRILYLRKIVQNTYFRNSYVSLFSPQSRSRIQKGRKGKIMAGERTLLSYTPEIKVVDCTIRDGGLTNDFFFTDQFVKDLYIANVKAGVDYMEFGYKASKDMFDVKKFGKWKFSDDEDIRAIVGDNNTNMKISVMADVGRCDYEKDIIDKKWNCGK